MHDIRAIRENPAAFDAALARRGLPGLSSDILALDEARRAKILAAETAQAEQNRASKDVGAAKARGDDAEFDRLRAVVAEKKAEIAHLTDEAATEDAKLRDILLTIDPARRAAALTIGYGLEPFVGKRDLADALHAGLPALATADWAEACCQILIALDDRLRQIIDRMSRTYGVPVPLLAPAEETAASANNW